MFEGLRVRLLTSLGTLVIAGVLGYPSVAQSQGNIELGPFRILPSLELSGEYNDNVVLAPRDEESDFIWTISPGVAAELPGRRYAVRLGYRADILRYVEQDQLDAVHHTARADARVNFAGGLSLYASDEFKRTTDFAGFPVPELTDRVERNENLFNAGAEYTVRERIGLQVDYKFFLVNYVDRAIFDELDRQDHLAALILYYRIMPKTSVLGEYNYQIIRYDQEAVARDRDSDAHKFRVGVKGDLTTKTSVLLKAGAEFKDYDNPAREDWTGLIVEGEVIWKYREPSQVRVFGGRANVESTFQENNFFVTTYGGAEVRHQITPKLLLRVTGLVGTNEYPERTTVGSETKERSDSFYEFIGALRYQIQRWLAVELGYGHLVRDSNFADFDFTNNRVKATVFLTF